MTSGPNPYRLSGTEGFRYFQTDHWDSPRKGTMSSWHPMLSVTDFLIGNLAFVCRLKALNCLFALRDDWLGSIQASKLYLC